MQGPAGPEAPGVVQQAAPPPPAQAYVAPPPTPPQYALPAYASVPVESKVPVKAWFSIAAGILGLALLPLGFILSMVAMGLGGVAWDDARTQPSRTPGQVAGGLGIALGVAGFLISRFVY